MRTHPTTFTLRAGAYGTTQTVAVTGDLDLLAGEPLTDLIDRAIGARPETLVVDLAATDFVDSTGVHCLMRGAAHAAARGVRLVVIPGPARVQRVFELCHLGDVLPFVGPPAQAAA